MPLIDFFIFSHSTDIQLCIRKLKYDQILAERLVENLHRVKAKRVHQISFPCDWEILDMT